ncbi:hypothetical protein CANCADRAFT_15987, partial [Tortispora caseinolytica NRRL Y-17796]
SAEVWDEHFQYNLLFDSHVHTTVSDGSLSPEQALNWAMAYGFQAIAITDHNDISGGLLAEEISINKSLPILVIPGMEFTCCRIHMNLIGINETIAPSSSWPSDEELQDVIRRTHELGGFVVVNHRAWSLTTEYGYQQPRIRTHPPLEALYEWGVDAFETVHEDVLDLKVLRFSKAHNLPLISASDMHHPTQVPSGWTLANVPSPISKESIISAFRQHTFNSTIAYWPEGPARRVYPQQNPQWDKWAPITGFDFSYLYSERNGMYSFVNGFCHERNFQINWRRGIFLVLQGTTAWLLYELLRGLYI